LLVGSLRIPEDCTQALWWLIACVIPPDDGFGS
jgi:hypothetical protein